MVFEAGEFFWGAPTLLAHGAKKRCGRGEKSLEKQQLETHSQGGFLRCKVVKNTNNLLTFQNCCKNKTLGGSVKTLASVDFT